MPILIAKRRFQANLGTGNPFLSYCDIPLQHGNPFISRIVIHSFTECLYQYHQYHSCHGPFHQAVLWFFLYQCYGQRRRVVIYSISITTPTSTPTPSWVWCGTGGGVCRVILPLLERSARNLVIWVIILLRSLVLSHFH